MSLRELDAKMGKTTELRTRLPDRITTIAKLEECYRLAFQLEIAFKYMWKRAKYLTAQPELEKSQQDILTKIMNEYSNTMQTVASLLIEVLVNVGNESALFQRAMSDLEEENLGLLRSIRNRQLSRDERQEIYLTLFTVACKRGRELPANAILAHDQTAN